MRPSDGVKELDAVLGSGGIFFVPKYIAQDRANIRRAFPDDEDFARAIYAIAHELGIARYYPNDHGVPCEHDLDDWRRSKFSSAAGADADLRLVFRAGKGGGVEVLAFGHRTVPDSVYYTAGARL